MEENTLHFISFRNKNFFVNLLEFNDFIFLFEDQNSFDEIIVPKSELVILASFINGCFLTPGGDIFTASNSIIRGVFSREEIEALIMSPFNTVLISITDPGTETPFFKTQFEDKLELKFHDIEEESKGFQLFSVEEALEILDFAIEHKNSRFVIHCEAGISRSAAVAVCLENIFGLEVGEVSIAETIRFRPNLFMLDTFNDILN